MIAGAVHWLDWNYPNPTVWIMRGAFAVFCLHELLLSAMCYPALKPVYYTEAPTSYELNKPLTLGVGFLSQQWGKALRHNGVCVYIYLYIYIYTLMLIVAWITKAKKQKQVSISWWEDKEKMKPIHNGIPSAIKSDFSCCLQQQHATRHHCVKLI